MSKPSTSARRRPRVWSMVWMMVLNRCTRRRCSNCTEPGSQTRALSLRSESAHSASEASSTSELTSALACSWSSTGSVPRLKVPQTGAVSTHWSSARTCTSGEAPNTRSPSLKRAKNIAG